MLRAVEHPNTIRGKCHAGTGGRSIVDIREQLGPAFSCDSTTDVIIRDVSGGDPSPATVHLQNTTTLRTDDRVKLIPVDCGA